MAGPLPVVGLAAVVADPLRGGVDEADVVDLELGDLEVAEPLEEGGDAAAEAVLLAGRGPLLDPALDDVVALAVGQLRVDLPGDLVGDLLHGDRHPDAGAGAVRELLLAGPREEAVDDEVLLGGRVVLERALDAVVVRRDEPVGRDERGAAAAERDDRVHREAGQVGPDLRVAREAELLQAGGEVGDLLRHPHPLVGDDGERGEKGRHEDDGDDGTLSSSGILPPEWPDPRLSPRGDAPAPRSVRGRPRPSCRTVSSGSSVRTASQPRRR